MDKLWQKNQPSLGSSSSQTYLWPPVL